jgi:hypothetical protein
MVGNAGMEYKTKSFKNATLISRAFNKKVKIKTSKLENTKMISWH